MQKIAVLTDSGCDVPRSAAETYNIHILPLKITYSGKTYTDNVDIAPRDVYDRFPREIPKTSTPNHAEIADMLDVIRSEGYTHVLCVCISSGLSGTYQTVCSALKEETSLVTYAFDTKNISIGAGIFALLAAEMAARGESFETIVETLERKRTDAKLFYYMDTLDYLVAGGRIGRVAGLVGGILKLKPIISCNEDGVYYPVGILKNKKRGVAKLIECAAALCGRQPVRTCADERRRRSGGRRRRASSAGGDCAGNDQGARADRRVAGRPHGAGAYRHSRVPHGYLTGSNSIIKQIAGTPLLPLRRIRDLFFYITSILRRRTRITAFILHARSSVLLLDAKI